MFLDMIAQIEWASSNKNVIEFQLSCQSDADGTA